MEDVLLLCGMLTCKAPDSQATLYFSAQSVPLLLVEQLEPEDSLLFALSLDEMRKLLLSSSGSGRIMPVPGFRGEIKTISYLDLTLRAKLRLCITY